MTETQEWIAAAPGWAALVMLITLKVWQWRDDKKIRKADEEYWAKWGRPDDPR